MTGYLIDTNVISELTRDTPHPRVVAFLSKETQVWLSSIVIHEFEFGLQLLPDGHRRDYLFEKYTDIVSTYPERVLSLDRPAAELAAKLRAQARSSGRIVDLGDALIAGTAMAHNLTIATRNVTDFETLGVDVFDPWRTI